MGKAYTESDFAVCITLRSQVMQKISAVCITPRSQNQKLTIKQNLLIPPRAKTIFFSLIFMKSSPSIP